MENQDINIGKPKHYSTGSQSINPSKLSMWAPWIFFLFFFLYIYIVQKTLVGP